MLQPNQVQEPFQQVIDFIGGLAKTTGIDQREFYRFIGSLEPPETPLPSRTVDEFIKDLNGRLPSTPEEIREAVLIGLEDIKAGRTEPIEEMMKELRQTLGKTAFRYNSKYNASLNLGMGIL